MARRRVASRREINPDPKFGDDRLAAFVNCIMRSGKKSIAEKCVYGALSLVEDQWRNSDESKGVAKKTTKKGRKDEGEGDESSSAGGIADRISGMSNVGLAIFYEALENARPTVEVRSRRVGGATYQVPVEVPMMRSHALGMRWLVDAARRRNEKGFIKRLAGELWDAAHRIGSAVKKREETHKMANANRAFAHFRF